MDINSMLKDSLPAGTRPFDFDRDELLVVAYVAKIEDSMFGFSRKLGSNGSAKAVGVRFDYDIIHVHSLRDKDHNAMILAIAVAFRGQNTHIGNQTIAGVDPEGVIWFRHGKQFTSSAEELKLREEFQAKMVDAVGGDIQGFLTRMFENGNDAPGDEWKND